MKARGFSYIELVIVVALLSIVLSFSMVVGMDSISRSSVIEERNYLVSLLLMGARSRALANVHQSSHGIHIDNEAHEYVLFEGDTYDPSNDKNRSAPFTSDHITITSVSSDIVFEQLSGNIITGTGTITISNSSATATINLNEIGQINW